MVAVAMAQGGLTADMFLQLTTTLAHMSAINTNASHIDVVQNHTDQDTGVSNNRTFLNLERGQFNTGLFSTDQYSGIDTFITLIRATHENIFTCWRLPNGYPVVWVVLPMSPRQRLLSVSSAKDYYPCHQQKITILVISKR